VSDASLNDSFSSATVHAVSDFNLAYLSQHNVKWAGDRRDRVDGSRGDSGGGRGGGDGDDGARESGGSGGGGSDGDGHGTGLGLFIEQMLHSLAPSAPP